MARPVTIFTGQWADLGLEQMCKLASDLGYDGLELASIMRFPAILAYTTTPQSILRRVWLEGR